MYKPTPHFLIAMAAATILYFGCTAIAGAADATVTGVSATQNTDGSPIPTDGSINSLRDVRIQYGPCNAAGTGMGTTTQVVTVNLLPSDAGQPFSKVITGLATVKQCFRARHSNIGDSFSDYSAVVVRDLTPPLRKPGAPTGISVASLQEDIFVSARWAAEISQPIVVM